MHGRLVVAVVAVLAGAPAGAQPNNEDSLVVLGWSKKGTHLALRSYVTSYGITTTCAFSAWIVDLVNDKVVWRRDKTWAESNVGGPEDTSPGCPGPKAAWEAERAGVEAALKRNGVTLAESREVKRFPFVTQSDSVDVTVAVVDRNYEVRASSRAKGTKVLSSGEIEEWAAGMGMGDGEPALLGWVASPDGTRIAVLLAPPCPNQMACAGAMVVGCHLRAGFVPPGEVQK